MSTTLVIGTKKGLFLLRGDAGRKTWDLSEPMLPGKEINHAMCDARTGRIFATSNDSWFGSEIVYSDDLGATWQSAKKSPSFAEASGQKLDRIWHVEAGREQEPTVLYAGVAPAALFRTADGGETWNEVESLTKHPTRERWHPGAGGLCLHSIQLEPSNPARMYVGISAVGVFRTDDAGKTWQTANRGTRAEFLPDKFPEYGQCVHKLLLAPGMPGLLYQQNHGGVYRSENAGQSWEEITTGLPSDFGFPLALHPRDPETAYVLPLKGGEFRAPPEGKARVFRTRDGGRNWQELDRGLPNDSYFGVLREGMTNDHETPVGIYFGTNTGKIYASIDEGETWSLIADNLPPISSLEATTLKRAQGA